MGPALGRGGAERRTSVFAGGNNLGADGLCLSGCIPMREPRWTGNRPMHLVGASQFIPITPKGRTGFPIRPALQALPEKGEPMSRLDEFLRLLCGRMCSCCYIISVL